MGPPDVTDLRDSIDQWAEFVADLERKDYAFDIDNWRNDVDVRRVARRCVVHALSAKQVCVCVCVRRVSPINHIIEEKLRSNRRIMRTNLFLTIRNVARRRSMSLLALVLATRRRARRPSTA